MSLSNNENNGGIGSESSPLHSNEQRIIDVHPSATSTKNNAPLEAKTNTAADKNNKPMKNDANANANSDAQTGKQLNQTDSIVTTSKQKVKGNDLMKLIDQAKAAMFHNEQDKDYIMMMKTTTDRTIHEKAEMMSEMPSLKLQKLIQSNTPSLSPSESRQKVTPSLKNSYPLPSTVNLSSPKYETSSTLLQSMYQQKLTQPQRNVDYERRNGPGAYRDLSIYPDPSPDHRRTRGGVTVPFPEKLYQMLEYTEKNELTDIVSFFPHGRAFAIHKPTQFVSNIMPKFFKQTRFTSFQRQLNLYGFRRISQGQDNGGYFHELFLKGRPGLCINMKRIKIKGADRNKNKSYNQPNFYNMPPIKKNSELKAKMDHPFPSMTENSAISTNAATSMSTRVNMPTPTPLSNFGGTLARSAGSSSGGVNHDNSGNVVLKSHYSTSRKDNINKSAAPMRFTNTKINQSRTMQSTPHFESADIYLSGSMSGKQYSSSVVDPNGTSNNNLNTFEHQRHASNIYSQGGNLDHDHTINPMIRSNFHNNCQVPDQMNRYSDMPIGNINIPPNILNSGFVNQAVPLIPMNQNMNLIGSHGGGSLGLASNNLAMSNSFTGQPSGQIDFQQNYFTPTSSAMPMQGMVNSNLVHCGNDQGYMSNFNPHYGDVASLSQSGISSTNNAFLGQQTGFSTGLSANAGLQPSNFIPMNSPFGNNRDMALANTNNVGSMMSQHHQSNNYTASNGLMLSTPFSEVSMNNSMMQNLPSYSSNQMNHLGAGTTDNLQTMNHIQTSKGFNSVSAKQLTAGNKAVTKNDLMNSTSDDNSFQIPFDRDALEEGNEDPIQEKGDPSSTSVTITKV